MFSWKNIVIIVLVLLVAGLLYAYWRQRQESKNMENYYEHGIDSIKRRIDGAGREHASMKVSMVPLDVYNNTKDSFISEMRKNTRAKDLVQHTKATISTRDSFKVTLHDTVYIAQGDTLPSKSFEWSDGYHTIYGSIVNADEYVDYDCQVPFSLTHKWVRPKWYKKKELHAEGVPENTKSRFTDMQSVVIQQPPKRFYETKAFAYGLGIITGIIINNKIN